MMLTALLDSNFLISIIVRQDMNHRVAAQALRAAVSENHSLIVAAPVMPELFYLIAKYAGYPTAVRAIKRVRRQFQIAPLTDADQDRMEQVMAQHIDAELDYTDAAIMALAERLNILQVYTFDRRDFALFKPAHCPALTLLP
jgi:hypothetical protein